MGVKSWKLCLFLICFIMQYLVNSMLSCSSEHPFFFSGVNAYQKCIESSAEKACEDNHEIDEIDEFKYYTQVLYTKYQWICRLGMLVWNSVPRFVPCEANISCRVWELFLLTDTPKCDATEVLMKLDTCRGFINLNVNPYLQDNKALSIFTQTACAGVNDFRECVRNQLDDRCTQLNSIQGIQQYVLDIPARYTHICEVTQTRKQEPFNLALSCKDLFGLWKYGAYVSPSQVSLLSASYENINSRETSKTERKKKPQYMCPTG